MRPRSLFHDAVSRSSLRRTGGGVHLALWPAVLALFYACGGGPDLDTRTFELQYLEPGEAVEMVTPYVYADRAEAPGVVRAFSGGLTVRETSDNLDRIGRVLAEYDRPKPGVRLIFQLIEADGAGEPDPRIRDVESGLRELFRFEGYRLVAETNMAAMEGTGSSQQLHDGMREFFIAANVHQIRGSAEKASVALSVELVLQGIGRAIQTSMAVPVGRTVVLGSTKPIDQPTLILTLRPELVTLADSPSS
jgi:hypothetical protein